MITIFLTTDETNTDKKYNTDETLQLGELL